jgi:integrase
MKIEENNIKRLPDNLRLRRGVYYAEFRIGRKRYRNSLETGVLTLARQRLKEMIANARFGILDAPRVKDLTLSEWSEEYVRTHLTTRVVRSLYQCRDLLRKVIVPYLGTSTLLGDITTPMLTRLRFEAWGKTNNATQNRKFALVKHFFSEAKRRNLIKNDPARDVMKLKEIPKKSKTLSDVQIKQVLLASGEPFRSYVLLSVSTGLRKGELLNLKRKHIEFDRATGLYWLHLRNEEGFRTKSGRDRKVPVHSLVQLELLISKIKFDAEALLFQPTGSGKLYNPRSAWSNVRSRLGLGDVTLHGLRRTFGTILHRSGVPIGTIQELMGHSTVNQTRAYIDTGHAELAKGIEGLDRTMECLVTDAPQELWAQSGHNADFKSQK